MLLFTPVLSERGSAGRVQLRAETFEQVRSSGSLTRKKVAAYFNLAPEQIAVFEVDERFCGYKITIQRAQSAGGPSERDLYGTGLYGSLSEYEIEIAPREDG